MSALVPSVDGTLQPFMDFLSIMTRWSSIMKKDQV